MVLNSKGQLTIPAHLRDKYGLHPGDDIEVVEVDGTLRIVRAVSVGYQTVEELEELLPSDAYGREQLPYLAGFAVGKAFLQYRPESG